MFLPSRSINCHIILVDDDGFSFLAIWVLINDIEAAEFEVARCCATAFPRERRHRSSHITTRAACPSVFGRGCTGRPLVLVLLQPRLLRQSGAHAGELKKMTPAVALTPALSPVDKMVERIDAAVRSAEISDTVDLNTLLMLLKCPASDQASTALLLEGLCYYSASLSSPLCTPARSSNLRALTREAIYLDFASIQTAKDKAIASSLLEVRATPAEVASEPHSLTKRVSFSPSVRDMNTTTPATPGLPSGYPNDTAKAAGETSVVSAKLVEAYKCFLRNTVSADSAFVADVLDACAFKLFRLPVPAFDNVVAAAHDVIPRILSMHPHAVVMCIRTFGDRYPHPVRPAEEHKSYARALLAVALYSKSDTLANAMISIVTEKLTVIDALVPEILWKPAEKGEIPPGETPPGADAEEAAPTVPKEDELEPEAEKMDAVLVEFCLFADSLSLCPEKPRNRRFKAIVESVERYILPAHCPKHVPMILLYAASSIDRAATLQVSESFRVSFHDPDMPVRLRASYIHYSAAMICRSSLVTALDTLAWLRRLTSWLHSYIDEHQDDETIAVDVDVHQLFYAGVFALMSVISVRLDVFGLHGNACVGDSDVANNMRFLRIMMSELNPLLVMPSKLVTSFCKAVEDNGDMRFDDILDDNLSKILPSRTRFGNRNRFSAFMPLIDCSLPATKATVKPYYRHGSRQRRRSSIGSLNNISILTSAVTQTSRKRSRACSENVDDLPENEERYAKRVRNF